MPNQKILEEYTGFTEAEVKELCDRYDMDFDGLRSDIVQMLGGGYDSVTKEAFIPNREIIEEFENAMSVGGWSEVMRVLKASSQLLEDTLNGNETTQLRGRKD